MTAARRPPPAARCPVPPGLHQLRCQRSRLVVLCGSGATSGPHSRKGDITAVRGIVKRGRENPAAQSLMNDTTKKRHIDSGTRANLEMLSGRRRCGAHGVWSGRAGSRQRTSRRPPPRSMAVVRVPEFPGWLLVSIVSGTRRMFVCCCFARWPSPVRPGPLIRPGPSPEARRSICLVAFQARKPLTQDTSRVPDQTRPVAANGQTARRDMEKWRHGSQAQLERRERAVEWPMPQHVATSLTVMSKSVGWRSRWQKAGCR